MDSKRIDWLGGEHDFALKMGQLRALQGVCDAGPEQVLNRVAFGEWRVDDLFETIRLGLIGGGMSTGEAGPLVDRLFKQHPIAEFKITALDVLSHALYAPSEDSEGNAEGA